MPSYETSGLIYFAHLNKSGLIVLVDEAVAGDGLRVVVVVAGAGGRGVRERREPRALGRGLQGPQRLVQEVRARRALALRDQAADNNNVFCWSFCL